MQVGRPAPGRHPEASLPGHGPLRRWEPRRVIAVRVGSQLGHGLRHLTVEFTMCVQRAVARRWQRAEVVEPGLSFSAMSVANLVSGRTTTVMTSLQSGARSAPHRRATSVVRTAQNGDRGQPAYPRSDLVPATGWLRPTPLLSQQHACWTSRRSSSAMHTSWSFLRRDVRPPDPDAIAARGGSPRSPPQAPGPAAAQVIGRVAGTSRYVLAVLAHRRLIRIRPAVALHVLDLRHHVGSQCSHVWVASCPPALPTSRRRRRSPCSIPALRQIDSAGRDEDTA